MSDTQHEIRRTVWKRVRNLLTLIGGVLFGLLLLTVALDLGISMWQHRPSVITRNVAYYRSLGYGPNQSRCLALGELKSSACLQVLVGPPQAQN